MGFSIVVTAPEERLEILSAELWDLGALGVEVQDSEVLPMPGTPPLPAGAGRCVAHFDHLQTAQAAAAALPQLGFEAPAPLEVPEQDWATAWRKFHRAVRVGPRSWVHPPWEVPDHAPEDALVCIDPGMAFGTGQHPTTALCAERIDELLSKMPGADLLDVGTGSGVLALLAVKLGAGRRVCGTENDPIALRVAAENAERNGLSKDRISWQLHPPAVLPAPFGAPYRIVVANILLNALTDLAPQIAAKVAPGGRLVLSGLLSQQGGLAEHAYEAFGLKPTGRRERDGWVRVELQRPA